MPAPRWVHELSLGLGWLSPSVARGWIDAARQAGLLRGETDLELAIEPTTVAIPSGFRPDPAAVPEGVPAADGFLGWVDKVAGASRRDRAAVLAEVHEVQDAYGGLLDADTAVWVLAAKAGLDVRRAAASGAAQPA